MPLGDHLGPPWGLHTAGSSLTTFWVESRLKASRGLPHGLRGLPLQPVFLQVTPLVLMPSYQPSRVGCSLGDVCYSEAGGGISQRLALPGTKPRHLLFQEWARKWGICCWRTHSF